MSFGKLVAQTATMILTGKVVNEGFERGKQKYAEYKERRAATGKDDPKQVGTVTQVDKDDDVDVDEA